MGLDEVGQASPRGLEEMNQIFIVTFTCLGLIVLLSLYMLVVVL